MGKHLISKSYTEFGESADVLQGEPQSMAIIYQLVTQACEQLVHSKYSLSNMLKARTK